MERRRLGVQDALWLVMDRPNNLMVVDSVTWTAEPLERDRARDVLVERLWDRYPVFRSRAVQDDEGHWWWEEDPAARFEDRVEYVELERSDDARCLQEVVARHRTEPLDRDAPLWRVLWVDRYRGGSALVLRTHHALADGMRMVQLSMSLFDATPEGGAILGPDVRHFGARGGGPGPSAATRGRSALRGLGHQVAGAGRVAATAGEQAASLARRMPAAASGAVDAARDAVTNPVGAFHGFITGAWAGAVEAVAVAGDTVRVAAAGSGPLVDLFSAAPGDVDSVRKLLVGTRNDPTIWTGKASTEKSVAWSEPLPLAEVKAVAGAADATVNDVLASCVAGTLGRYLSAHHQRCASVAFMVPVNLTPIDLTLPDELGNSFALVQLELPTGHHDPLALLHTTRHRMDRIKHGHEAAIAFRLQETISGLNRSVYEASVDLLANRTVGTLTNVPGPPVPVYLAGCRVEGMIGWAPLSGDQPLSFTIYSYDGNVTVGVACDRQLVPDHEMIVEGFGDAFGELRARVGVS